MICLVEDHSTNISIIQNICNELAINLHFLIVSQVVIATKALEGFIPLVASEEMIVCGNLAFLLPWQPIKFRGLDKNMFGRGLLKEHICKILV